LTSVINFINKYIIVINITPEIADVNDFQQNIPFFSFPAPCSAPARRMQPGKMLAVFPSTAADEPENWQKLTKIGFYPDFFGFFIHIRLAITFALCYFRFPHRLLCCCETGCQIVMLTKKRKRGSIPQKMKGPGNGT